MPEVVMLLLVGAVGLGGILAFATGNQKLGYTLGGVSTLATTMLGAARLLKD